MKTDPKDMILIIFITLIGLFIRIVPSLAVSFPLNDGGLFYKMMLDLQENHFVLPMFTTYNHANIPFAYPPLAFYLYTIVSGMGNVSVIKLMQFGPAIISALCIPAFFLLARQILDTKPQVFLSVLIFTLVPRAFDWLIMGGGVTRSLGFLFALLAIGQCILVFSSPSTRNMLLMILWSGLVVLTHPEAAIHTFIASILIYLWKDFTISGLKRAAIIAGGTLLLASPWWGTILSRHGMGPFVAVLASAGQDSDNLIARLLILFRFDFTDEPFLTLISAFGLIGLFIMLVRRRPALPLWLFLIQLIEPRGGPLYMMIPISLLAGFALDQAILPLLQTPTDPNKPYAIFRLNPEKAFIGFIFLYGLLSAASVTSKIAQQLTLTQSDLKAFQWVRENTSNNDSFLLITQGVPFNDASSEWFPALTERTSRATIFGYEWLHDGNFRNRIKSYEELQGCAFQGQACLEQWDAMRTDYVYIRGVTKNKPIPLTENLKSSRDYRVVYETEDTIIFLKAP